MAMKSTQLYQKPIFLRRRRTVPLGSPISKHGVGATGPTATPACVRKVQHSPADPENPGPFTAATVLTEDALRVQVKKQGSGTKRDMKPVADVLILV